ncbi:hypothetical protein Q2T40_15405 [Winogradskyella maritima]|uniref:Uncharacterized protein n=1 Tax=Winogradskyella maritima TaxID=1517766 RepID=A0ABV8AJ22_9FLAO|nr:hypothetical protein [Winogradskyella maritima]
MRKKDVIFGFLIGLASAGIGILLYDIILGLINGDSISTSFSRTWSTKFLGKRASVGALINLPVFYLFLNRKNEDYAKGVLMATMLIAVIFIINRF